MNCKRRMQKIMQIYESAEDYLETILILSRKKGNVRAVDIANELNYKRSSVSVAMKHLREDNYIEVSSSGYITLTDKGAEIALNIYERHTILTDILLSIGVPQEIAAKDACKIEHDLSPETIKALRDVQKKLKTEGLN